MEKAMEKLPFLGGTQESPAVPNVPNFDNYIPEY